MPLTILAKSSILDIWQGSEWASDIFENELVSGICYLNILNH